MDRLTAAAEIFLCRRPQTPGPDQRFPGVCRCTGSTDLLRGGPRTQSTSNPDTVSVLASVDIGKSGSCVIVVADSLLGGSLEASVTASKSKLTDRDVVTFLGLDDSGVEVSVVAS